MRHVMSHVMTWQSRDGGKSGPHIELGGEIRRRDGWWSSMFNDSTTFDKAELVAALVKILGKSVSC